MQSEGLTAQQAMAAIATGVGTAVQRFWPNVPSQSFVVLRLEVAGQPVTLFGGNMPRELAIEELLNLAAALEKGASYEAGSAPETHH